MKHLFLLLWLPLFVFAQSDSGGSPPSPTPITNPLVSVSDWYVMLDSVFYWDEYNLPETTAVERARAMQLSWSEPKQLNEQLIGWNIYLSLSDLFFGFSQYKWENQEDAWLHTKWTLQYYFQINLDSVEASARGSEKFSLGLNDNVSRQTLEYFSKQARKTPMLVPQAIITVNYDWRPFSFVLRQNGDKKIAGFLTRFTCRQDKIDLISSSINWKINLGKSHYANGEIQYSLGVIRLDGKFSSDERWIPTELEMKTDYSVGSWQILQNFYSAQYVDTDGNDHYFWALSVLWRIYPRGDVNRTYNLSLGDVISQVNLLLSNKEPSILNLGDITQDGVFDQQDPFATFQTVLYGSWGKGRVVSSKDSIKKENPSGTLIVEKFSQNNKSMVRVKFEGTPGKSLGLILENSKNSKFLGSHLNISASKETESSLRILRFSEKPSAEIFLEAETFGDVVAKPLNGKYFFTPNEDIKIVYRVSSPTSVMEDPIPSDFGLNQNYPNPFNPETVISFNLPEVSKVRLGVYNTLGELIATLADGEFSAGQHALLFDGSRLASGIYFYRLETNQFSKTMKMILSK